MPDNSGGIPETTRYPKAVLGMLPQTMPDESRRVADVRAVGPLLNGV